MIKTFNLNWKLAVYHINITGNLTDSTMVHGKPRIKSRPPIQDHLHEHPQKGNEQVHVEQTPTQTRSGCLPLQVETVESRKIISNEKSPYL